MVALPKDPRFDSQYLHGRSQLSNTQFQGIRCLLVLVSTACMWCVDTHEGKIPICIINFLIFFEISYVFPNSLLPGF